MEILPIRNDIPAYNFSLELDLSTFFFTFRYNERMNRWIMDINDENEDPIFLGIPLLVNQELDTFGFEDLPIGTLFMVDDKSEQRQPTKELFSAGLKLFYATQAEVAAIGT